MSFRSDLIIKLSIEEAVRWRYGKDAKVEYTGPHAYNIQANVNGQVWGLDLLAYVKSLYPAACPVMSGGVSNDCWHIYDSYKLSKQVIPVIILTNETRWKIDLIKERVFNLNTILVAAQEWLRREIGKTWSLTPPIILDSNTDAAKVQALNNDAKAGGFQYHDYWSQIAKTKLGTAFDNKNCRYLVIPIDSSAGSSHRDNIAIVQSAVTYSQWNPWMSTAFSNTWDVADNITTVVHELLHSFGLDHTYTSYPNHPDKVTSIMGYTRIPQAILIPEEKEILKKHEWLR